MTNQIATTKEQSQRLIACGVNPDSADMCYLYWDESGEQLSRDEWLECEEGIDRGESYLIPKDFGMYDYSYSDDAPAWSLSALLALLPMEIRKDGMDFTMALKPYPHEEECYRWCISYYDNELEATAYYSEAPDPIEACVRMVRTLTDNGYKLNGN